VTKLAVGEDKQEGGGSEKPIPAGYFPKSLLADVLITVLSLTFLALDILLFPEFKTSQTGILGALLESSIETGAVAIALVIMQIWVLLVLTWTTNATSVKYLMARLFTALLPRR